MARALLGSVAEKMVRASPAPVLTIGATEGHDDATFRHILVPTDFGPIAEHALHLAVRLASNFGAKLTLLHVADIKSVRAEAYVEGLAWPKIDVEKSAQSAQSALDRQLSITRKQHPNVEGVLLEGEPWREIVNAAKARGADLIVLGTHGRHGIPRLFLGSVAERVVRYADVPTMTVRTDDHKPAEQPQREPTSDSIEASSE